MEHLIWSSKSEVEGPVAKYILAEMETDETWKDSLISYLSSLDSLDACVNYRGRHEENTGDLKAELSFNVGALGLSTGEKILERDVSYVEADYLASEYLGEHSREMSDLSTFDI